MEEAQDASSMTVTPVWSKGALGTWRSQGDSRTRSRGEVTVEAGTSLWVDQRWRGVCVSALEFRRGCGKARKGKPRSEPDWGNPKQRWRCSPALPSPPVAATMTRAHPPAVLDADGCTTAPAAPVDSAVCRGKANFHDRTLAGLGGNGRACSDCHWWSTRTVSAKSSPGCAGTRRRHCRQPLHPDRSTPGLQICRRRHGVARSSAARSSATDRARAIGTAHFVASDRGDDISRDGRRLAHKRTRQRGIQEAALAAPGICGGRSDESGRNRFVGIAPRPDWRRRTALHTRRAAVQTSDGRGPRRAA